MSRYSGSCHCGRVTFEVDATITFITDCNCSICSAKGLLHLLVPPEQFRLLSGADQLATYQFGTRTAKHHFCTICGVQPFTRPRAFPDMYTVNVRCLEGAEQIIQSTKVMRFDGKNWEAAVAAIRERGLQEAVHGR